MSGLGFVLADRLTQTKPTQTQTLTLNPALTLTCSVVSTASLRVPIAAISFLMSAPNAVATVSNSEIWVNAPLAWLGVSVRFGCKGTGQGRHLVSNAPLTWLYLSVAIAVTKAQPSVIRSSKNPIKSKGALPDGC